MNAREIAEHIASTGHIKTIDHLERSIERMTEEKADLRIAYDARDHFLAKEIQATAVLIKGLKAQGAALEQLSDGPPLGDVNDEFKKLIWGD